MSAPKRGKSKLHQSGGRELADHRPAMRKCLGRCGQMFHSRGPGNRICGKCDVANLSVYLAKGER